MRLSALLVLLCFAAFGLFQAPPAAAQSESNFFIDNTDDVLTGRSDWWVQRFATSGQKFAFRFASDKKADAAIVLAGDIEKFKAGKSFRGYAVLAGTFGTKGVVLPKGNYYVAMRNRVNELNYVSVELDYPLTLSKAWRYLDAPIKGNESLSPNGGKHWQQFKMQKDVRLFVDGCNSGVVTYIIPASELTKFRNNQTHDYYTAYSGANGNFPGLYEITLPPGTYYLCFKNFAPMERTVTYTSYRYTKSN